MRTSAAAPFPGLRPYEVADAPWFFGRGAQVEALLDRLAGHRFVAVVGGSGVGKSSLVNAGLLPRLRELGDRRRVLTMKPRGAPREALALAFVNLLRNEGLIEPKDATSQALLDHVRTTLGRSSLGVVDLALEWLPASDPGVLLLVDQFEEVFRYELALGTSAPRVDDDAAAFVALLLAAAGAGEVALDVMLTLRADFIGDCIRFEGLPEAISDGQYLVPRLVREQVEEVIRKPVAKAGATIDHDLVEQLLNDNVREPDALPVLQHVLMRIWDKAGCDPAGTTKSEHSAPGLADAATPFLHGRLTLDHYRSIGLWQDALSRHANEVMDELEAGPDGPAMAITVQQVFRALSDVDRAGRATRRPIPFRQLCAETGCTCAQVRAVLDAMRAEGRAFLRPPVGDEVQDDTIVDIGHEALIRRWDKVQDPDVLDERGKPTGWLRDEERDGQAYRSLLEIAEEGEHSGSVAFLPIDQATSRWDWWSHLVRTDAWAMRYGGERQKVLNLLERSNQAARAELQRRQEERHRDEERRQLEERTAKAERDLLEANAREAESARLQWRRIAAIVGCLLFALIIAFGWVITLQREARARAAEAAAGLIWSRLDFDAENDPAPQTVHLLWDLSKAPPNVREAFLAQLASDSSQDVLAKLAKLACPACSLAQLASDSSQDVSAKLAKLAKCPTCIRKAFGLWPNEADAAQLLKAACDAVLKTTDGYQLQALGQIVQALGARLTPDQAQAALAPILEAIPRTTNSYQLQALGQAAQALGPTPDQAQAALAPILEAIPRTTDIDQLQGLGQAAQALGARLTPDQAQAVLAPVLEAISRTTDGYQLQALGQAAQALGPTPDQAQAALAPILEAIPRTTDGHQLQALGQAVQALGARLTPDQAQAALAPILEAIPRTKDVWALQGLGQAVQALGARLPKGAYESAVAVLKTPLATMEQPDTASALAGAIAALWPAEPPKCYAATIVELLKWPTTAGPATDVLLDALHQRVPGAPSKEVGLDATLDWVAKNWDDMNLTSPPVQPGADSAGRCT